MTHQCPQCQAVLQSGSRFCHVCGISFVNAVPRGGGAATVYPMPVSSGTQSAPAGASAIPIGAPIASTAPSRPLRANVRRYPASVVIGGLVLLVAIIAFAFNQLNSNHDTDAPVTTGLQTTNPAALTLPVTSSSRPMTSSAGSSDLPVPSGGPAISPEDMDTGSSSGPAQTPEADAPTALEVVRPGPPDERFIPSATPTSGAPSITSGASGPGAMDQLIHNQYQYYILSLGRAEDDYKAAHKDGNTMAERQILLSIVNLSNEALSTLSAEIVQGRRDKSGDYRKMIDKLSGVSKDYSGKLSSMH